MSNLWRYAYLNMARYYGYSVTRVCKNGRQFNGQKTNDMKTNHGPHGYGV